MTAYFVPNRPSSGEAAQYNRRYVDFHFKTSAFTWRWAFSADKESPKENFPAVRAIVDGLPVGDFVQSTNGSYDFVLDIPDGQHIIDFEGTGVEVLKKAFSVQVGPELVDTDFSYTTASRFERLFGNAPSGAQAKISTVDILKPKLWPVKARVAEKFNTLPATGLHGRDLWVRNPQTHGHGMMTRRLVELLDGTKKFELDNKYFYSEAVRGPVGLRPPLVTLRDGPRGVGTLGYLYKTRISPNDTGFYWSDTVGRSGFTWWDGRVVTFAGWALPEGVVKASNAYRRAGATPEEEAFYDSKWQMVGDWSQVTVGPKSFHGLWGFAGIGHDEDPTDGFHEFFHFDALSGRILYGNHYTAHSLDNYQLPRFAPPGYVAPAAPTGQMQMFVVASGLNEPWDGVIKKIGNDYWLYFSEFRGNAIKRVRMGGAWEMEDVLISSKQPNDAGLGVPAPYADSGEPNWRQWPSTWNEEQFRAAGLIIDGPPGEATCIRPQALDLDSEGRLYWVEMHTYQLRRIEHDGQVTTIGPVKKSADTAITIDREGTFGPKDDIFCKGWWQADTRYSVDGVRRPNFYTFTSSQLINGPADWVRPPGYGWGLDVRHGRLLLQGSAASWQCIEVTKRQPTDPVFDVPRIGRGETYWRELGLVLTHGPQGHGEVGYPYIEEMGSWPQQQLRDYFTSLGAAAGQLDDLVYYVWALTIENDYGTEPPPPSQDCVLSDWSEWGPWEVDAVDPTREVRTRTRVVETPPANGGAECGPTEEIEMRPVAIPGPTREEALAGLDVAKLYIEGT